MAPEYALWGYLSDKADVYSFGIVVLEIVSGKNNNSYIPSNNCICLLDWVPFLLLTLVRLNTGTSIFWFQYLLLILNIDLITHTHTGCETSTSH